MKLFISLLLTFSIQGFSATFSFLGPCSKKPLLKSQYEIEGISNVGEATIALLMAEGAPFKGTEAGMNSIFNTPTGLDSMEVLGDREMLAYGWCYAVNGFEPAKYPNEVKIKNEDSVVWWYGYARYLEGEWISQCEPSHTRRSPQFCRNFREEL